MYDICIIGGGAAGMTAAITAGESDNELNILILEKKEQLGKKVLASGNGKCNLSNERCKDYRDTLSFFQGLGVVTRVDDAGRIYPYTEDAGDVVEALERRMDGLKIRRMPGAQVTDVSAYDGGFQVTFTASGSENKIACSRLLIAGGGKAGPQFGTTGDCYRLARKLGHSVTRLAPGLTAVELVEDTADLAGIRAKARVVLKYKDEEVFEETGEVQFTRYGISGICVFNMSRFMDLPEGRTLKDGFVDYTISIDFFPKGGNIEGFLRQRAEMPGMTGAAVMQSMVRKPIAERIYDMSGGSLEKMAELLRGFPLHPKGLKGWDMAQVTRGGIPLTEINTETMESLITPGLFFAGEILDYDGPCGGYNLENAWQTGIAAGKGMSR
jgi:predicted Rossmann fold flavoprotein